MIALILVVLIQAQESSIESRIDSFIKGDPAARVELLKLAAFAIRPLQRSREKAPEKIDSLILELKKTAAHPRGSAAVAILDRGYTSSSARNSVAGAMDDFEKHKVPLFYVYADLADRDQEKTMVFGDKETVTTALDQFCRLTGMDYGIFHNSIVLAKPDRLWPSRRPPAPPPLPDDARRRGEVLIAQLGSESLEARERATAELFEIGPGVRSLLESHHSRLEAEAAARCAALIEQFQPAPWMDFGPALAMKGDKQSAALLAKLQEARLEFGISASLPFSILDDYLFDVSGVRFINRAADRKAMLVFWMGHNVLDQLCLNLQSHKLDFLIKDGRGVIDTREALEKLQLSK